MNDKKLKKPELLPDIEEYFESLGNNYPINIVGLEHIREAIYSKTKLSEFNSDIILRLFFQEIRNSILKKEKVDFRSLGSFFISSPETSNNAKKIFVKFKPKKSLIKKINEK